MSTNIAATYAEPGTFKIAIEQLSIPEPEAGQVLVKITHSGVCHSDLGVCGELWPILEHPTPKGQVGGHEGIGEVVKLGPGVTKPKIGSRIGIKWLADVCGNCPACLENDDNFCSAPKVSGYYTPGTFQQYVTTSANYATPIPDGIDSAAAAPFLCAGLTVYSGLKKTNTKPGDWIVISGAGGGLGHLAVQYASRVYGLRVIGIDHGSKKDLVLECGAEVFYDFTQFDDTTIVEAVKKVTTHGRGAHAVMVLSAANKSYEQGLKFLKPLGTLITIGMPEGVGKPIESAHPALITRQQWRIIGSAIGTRQEAIDALSFAARGLVKCHYKVEKLENLGHIF